jgi:hypothetical protein
MVQKTRQAQSGSIDVECLVLRHAQRDGPKIVPHDIDDERIRLTAAGEADSLSFGRQLKERFPSYTFLRPQASPKMRTLLTAKLISEGYLGRSLDLSYVEVNQNLFPWMGNDRIHDVAKGYVEKYADGAFFLANYDFSDEEVGRVAAPIAHIVTGAIDSAKALPAGAKTLQIAITHDYNLLSFAYYVAPRDMLGHYRENPLSIPVLTGLRVSAKADDNGKEPVTFYWKDGEFKVDLSRLRKLSKYYESITQLAKKLASEKFDFTTSYFK